MYKRNIKARSRYDCCRGKAISIKYYDSMSVFLRYPACKAHAPYFIVICGLSGSTIFFPHYLTKGTIFGRKLLNIKCVF